MINILQSNNRSKNSYKGSINSDEESSIILLRLEQKYIFNSIACRARKLYTKSNRVMDAFFNKLKFLNNVKIKLCY